MNIEKLNYLIKTSTEPIYILVAGSVGSGKSYIVEKYLKDIHIIDPDIFTMQLGNGIYDGKNVSASMAMVKKAVVDRLHSKKTFLQQGTSANLQSTINKLSSAKENGFKTVLLYIDTPIDQSLAQIENRVKTGGHGATINRKKVENTYNGSRLTYRVLSGIDYKSVSTEDLLKVNKVLDKIDTTLDKARGNLDHFIMIQNIIN